MNLKGLKLIFVSTVYLFLLSFGTPSTGNLTVDLKNIKSTDGMIWIALYDSEETLFDREKAILKGLQIEKTGTMQIVLNNIELGRYALAAFHDENNNGELDQNFFGIPTEPYAFIAKPKSKWRLPKWHELSFQFTTSGQKLTATLTTWWDS